MKLIGCAAYLVFSLVSLFIVAAAAGFWPFFAWLLLLLYAPHLLLEKIGYFDARARRKSLVDSLLL
jgi:hypothetical protein